MRKSAFYILCIALPVLFSCNQTDHKTANQKDSLALAAADTLVNTSCFNAIDGKDTASLNLKTLNSGKINGTMVINFAKKAKNDGEVEGKYNGDTLFVDYTFKIGTNKTVYKNPLAFLKKDGKLILGVGQIETSLGKSYFVKGEPIHFDKGRFIFSPVDCAK